MLKPSAYTAVSLSRQKLRNSKLASPRALQAQDFYCMRISRGHQGRLPGPSPSSKPSEAVGGVRPRGRRGHGLQRQHIGAADAPSQARCGRRKLGFPQIWLQVARMVSAGH